jgi:hypothetical protein
VVVPSEPCRGDLAAECYKQILECLYCPVQWEPAAAGDAAAADVSFQLLEHLPALAASFGLTPVQCNEIQQRAVHSSSVCSRFLSSSEMNQLLSFSSPLAHLCRGIVPTVSSAPRGTAGAQAGRGAERGGRIVRFGRGTAPLDCPRIGNPPLGPSQTQACTFSLSLSFRASCFP